MNINVNGSLQIILILFIMSVGIILANLIVGLTVNKTEELFQKADMHFNIKVCVKETGSRKDAVLKMSKVCFDNFQRVNQINMLESLLTNRTSGVPFLKRIFRRFSLDNVQLFLQLEKDRQKHFGDKDQ